MGSRIRRGYTLNRLYTPHRAAAVRGYGGAGKAAPGRGQARIPARAGGGHSPALPIGRLPGNIPVRAADSCISVRCMPSSK